MWRDTLLLPPQTPLLLPPQLPRSTTPRECLVQLRMGRWAPARVLIGISSVCCRCKRFVTCLFHKAALSTFGNNEAAARIRRVLHIARLKQKMSYSITQMPLHLTLLLILFAGLTPVGCQDVSLSLFDYRAGASSVTLSGRLSPTTYVPPFSVLTITISGTFPPGNFSSPADVVTSCALPGL